MFWSDTFKKNTWISPSVVKAFDVAFKEPRLLTEVG